MKGLTLALLLFASTAAADPITPTTYIYTYTGNPFTTLAAGDMCLGDCALTITTTTTTPLPANYVGNNIDLLSLDTTWSDGFTTRGVQDFIPGPSGDYEFVREAHMHIFATDENAIPTAWLTYVQYDWFSPRHFQTSTQLWSEFGLPGYVGTGVDYVFMNDPTGVRTYSASNANNPGIWTVTTVPEPSTWPLMTIGLGSLVLVRRHRVLRTSGPTVRACHRNSGGGSPRR
jgi:hypothetical protein